MTTDPLGDDLRRFLVRGIADAMPAEERMRDLAEGVVELHRRLPDADPRAEATISMRATLAECERSKWTLEWAQAQLAEEAGPYGSVSDKADSVRQTEYG